MAKIVVCSDNNYGCGKSSSIIRFVNNQFIEEYDPLVEDFFWKEVNIDDMTITLKILDLAGAEYYNYLKHCVLNVPHKYTGVLFLYDITNRSSFDAITNYESEILRIKKENVPFILCGNRIDLEKQRQVQTWEGQQKADSLGVSFIEMSAKTGENINEAFFILTRQIVQKNPKYFKRKRKEKLEKKECYLL